MVTAARQYRVRGLSKLSGRKRGSTRSGDPVKLYDFGTVVLVAAVAAAIALIVAGQMISG